MRWLTLCPAPPLCVCPPPHLPPALSSPLLLLWVCRPPSLHPNKGDAAAADARPRHIAVTAAAAVVGGGRVAVVVTRGGGGGRAPRVWSRASADGSDGSGRHRGCRPGAGGRGIWGHSRSGDGRVDGPVAHPVDSTPSALLEDSTPGRRTGKGGGGGPRRQCGVLPAEALPQVPIRRGFPVGGAGAGTTGRHPPRPPRRDHDRAGTDHDRDRHPEHGTDSKRDQRAGIITDSGAALYIDFFWQ